MNKIRLGFLAAVAIAALALITATPAYAGVDDREEAAEEVIEANEVFTEIMSKPDEAIPRELLENATAVGIFPDVLKAAFILGGSRGEGVVIRRNEYGLWETPAFYDISGASFGLQIGGKSTDYIMLFMNEDALRELEDDKLEFGGNVSFAAGPVGRTAGASTNATLDAGILTWSRSEGAFAGVSLKGALLTADNDKNNAIYGLNGSEVLSRNNVSAALIARDPISELRSTLLREGGTSTTNSRAFRNEATFSNAAFRNTNLNRYVNFERNSNANLRKGPKVRMARMQTLARRVRNELLTLPYYSVFDWIEFEIDREGIVTLDGKVTTPPDTISRAEAYVADIEGVEKVINRIEALPASPSDDRLRRSLYYEIYSGPLFRYQVGSLQNIHIIVENGRVTLEGVVDSAADKNIAKIRASSVPGVFSVRNELAVRPEAE